MPPKKKADPAVSAQSDPTPAEAAAADASGTDEDSIVVVTFRGTDFTIPRYRIESLHFRLAMSRFDYGRIMTEALDFAQVEQLLLLVDRKDDPLDAAGQFVDALGKAAGWGNSQSSG